MYACFGLIHLPHTELTRSQTLHQLSQCQVRLHINWVNAEWDSTSTEPTQSKTPRQLSQHRRHQHLRRFYHSVLTQLTWSLTLRWLSCREVSLGVDSVDEDWDSASTVSPPNVKKFEYVGEFKNRIEKIQKPYYLAYMCLISAKNENKNISCKCTFKSKIHFLIQEKAIKTSNIA